MATTTRLTATRARKLAEAGRGTVSLEVDTRLDERHVYKPDTALFDEA